MTGWRSTAAAAHDLPPGLSEWLRGETEAELMEDARKMAACLRPSPADRADQANELARRALAHAAAIRKAGV